MGKTPIFYFKLLDSDDSRLIIRSPGLNISNQSQFLHLESEEDDVSERSSISISSDENSTNDESFDETQSEDLNDDETLDQSEKMSNRVKDLNDDENLDESEMSNRVKDLNDDENLDQNDKMSNGVDDLNDDETLDQSEMSNRVEDLNDDENLDQNEKMSNGVDDLNDDETLDQSEKMSNGVEDDESFNIQKFMEFYDRSILGKLTRKLEDSTQKVDYDIVSTSSSSSDEDLPTAKTDEVPPSPWLSLGMDSTLDLAGITLLSSNIDNDEMIDPVNSIVAQTIRNYEENLEEIITNRLEEEFPELEWNIFLGDLTGSAIRVRARYYLAYEMINKNIIILHARCINTSKADTSDADNSSANKFNVNK